MQAFLWASFCNILEKIETGKYDEADTTSANLERKGKRILHSRHGNEVTDDGLNLRLCK